MAFGDEIEAVQREATALREGGVEIIIALGHSGYEIDQVTPKKGLCTFCTFCTFTFQTMASLTHLHRNWQGLCLSWTLLLEATLTPSSTRKFEQK